MSQTFQARLQSINRTMLTPLVRQALNNSTAEILDWDQHILAGGTGREVLSVVHFSGSAQMQNEVMPWSLVLKAISGTHESASADIHAWNYWKREVLVYQSGLLSDLDGDMVAPHCFGVVEYPNQEYWIWLEYIQEDKVVWPLERYQLAARHLGQFNGSYYLVGSSLQGYPWLTRGHLRQHLALGEPGLQKLQNLSRHPRSWVTVDTTERTVNLYANRERLLNHIDHLPHCFCHFDAFRRNLRSRQSGQGKDQTMLIDWSAAGLGAIGEEIATLVVISLLFLEVPSKDMTRLNTLAVEGYLAGLREAGWNGNEDDVRFAYTASAAILALSLTGILLPGIEDDEQCIRWEQSSGYPLDVILSQLRELHQLALDLGEEAQTLLKWLVP